jgi:hypothetical protein
MICPFDNNYLLKKSTFKIKDGAKYAPFEAIRLPLQEIPHGLQCRNPETS